MKEINAEGVMLPGRKIHGSLVHQILRKRLYMGEFDWDGTTYAGTHEPLVTRERHRAALERAAREIEGFRSARDEGIEGAVAATHLRAAVSVLEDVIGVVTREDVLDRLFATFCVGK